MSISQQVTVLDARQGFRGRVIDLDTGGEVFGVFRALSARPGYAYEVEAYQLDSVGNKKTDLNGNYLTYRAGGRFRVLPARPPVPALTQRKPPALGALKCARCPKQLTLPGDDLCPACRAKERGQRNRMSVEPVNPLEIRACCVKYCGRRAYWSVCDETEASPQYGERTNTILFPTKNGAGRAVGKYLYARGATVGRRYYCAFHWQAPRLLDPKGEVIGELETNVRPDGTGRTLPLEKK